VVACRWQLLDLSPDATPLAGEPRHGAGSFDGSAPGAQWQARSAFSIARGVELDGMLFHSGELRNLQIGAYTRADARLAVPLTRGVSLVVVGQNLFDPEHAEFAGAGAVVTSTLVPRSGSINLVWRPRP